MDARSRSLVLALVLSLLGSAAPASAQQAGSRSQPAKSETHYVEGERAVAYAGPSEDYYPTSVLKRGDAVEVYEQTEDGWLAIRPPQGSFSWLPATQGFLLPGGRIVEVTEAEAVSWIGSALGTAKQYRWQVRLARGEQLSVIGEQTLSDGQADKKTLWYKITPPNGEFRWIRAEAVSRQSPTENYVATAGEASSSTGEDGEVITAAASDEAGAQSILQASAEEVIDGELAVSYAQQSRSGQSHAGRQHGNRPGADSTSGEDRWSTWHAVEFKDGSFSFPGVARMLGMEPAPTSGSHDGYDPFDLAASATTARRNEVGDGPAQALGSADSATPAVEGPGMPVGPRKARGWRDPRQLRDMRAHGQTAVYGDLSYAGDPAVGTGVVAASAAGPSKDDSPAADDAQWYGIVQAPQASSAQPMALQQADLGEIQFRLSEMVSGPEHTWNLAPLADRTRYLIEHGTTAIERGEARLMLDRIEAFADVARRSTELGMTPPVALPTAVNASISASPIAAAASRWASPLGLSSTMTEGSSASAPRFDATGWIIQVHSSNPDMPTHALSNDAGRIIVYLSPAAGVNLARYQGQAVGVYGLRGYLPQLKANHIQVQRAVRLH